MKKVRLFARRVPVSHGTLPKVLSELLCEVTRAVQPQREANIHHGALRFPQETRGVFHPPAGDKALQSFVFDKRKRSAEMEGANRHHPRYCGQTERLRIGEMIIDILLHVLNSLFPEQYDNVKARILDRIVDLFERDLLGVILDINLADLDGDSLER